MPDTIYFRLFALSLAEYICYSLKIPGKNGGISFSGKTLNVTGDAQVRFRLACQPCNCYLLPVNGVKNKRALPPTGEIGEAKLYTPLWGGGTVVDGG